MRALRCARAGRRQGLTFVVPAQRSHNSALARSCCGRRCSSSRRAVPVRRVRMCGPPIRLAAWMFRTKCDFIMLIVSERLCGVGT